MSTLYTNIHKFLESNNSEFPGDNLQLKVQFVYDETDEVEGLVAIASICAQDGDYSWPHRLNNVGLVAESALSEGGCLDDALKTLDKLIEGAL